MAVSATPDDEKYFHGNNGFNVDGRLLAPAGEEGP
jgi:hypothetical protein